MADPAVRILPGAMPVESVIHKRELVPFGSLCRLDEESVKKSLSRRQVAIESFDNNSLFVATPKLFFKYDLPDCWDMVENPRAKMQWKSLVQQHVNDYWMERIKSRALLYLSLEYLTVDEYYPGNRQITTAFRCCSRYPEHAYKTEACDWHLHTASEQICL